MKSHEMRIPTSVDLCRLTLELRDGGLPLRQEEREEEVQDSELLYDLGLLRLLNEEQKIGKLSLELWRASFRILY